jgi:competence protein ComGC
MKLGNSNRQTRALTLVEVLVVIVVIAAFVLWLLPRLAMSQRRTARIGCINNLKEVALASKIWAADNNDKYPMQVPVVQGGVMELAITGNVVAVFQVMSNELSSPKILHCWEDTKHQYATNFTTDFSSQNISYFVGLDASTNNPISILYGDDNFQINGTEVKSGVLELTTNTPIAWTTTRHSFGGNIVLIDGSAWRTANSELRSAITKQYEWASGFTNRFRWAIP